MLVWLSIILLGCHACLVFYESNGVDAFVSTKNVRTMVIHQRQSHHYEYWNHRQYTSSSQSRHLLSSLQMLRNVDLPECIIFYGVDTVLEPNWSTKNKEAQFRPGVIRLCQECEEVGTGIIWLSEHISSNQLQQLWDIATTTSQQKNNNKAKKSLLFQCTKEVFTLPLLFKDEQEDEDDDDDEEEESYGRGYGYAPSPAALIDAISSIVINPRGFGGSSGFASSQHIDPQRNPLPPHTVVFVSSLSSHHFNRCLASWYAGMRVLLIADSNNNQEDDVPADAIIDETLGTDQDWSMITLDDVSTPGSFWLNMAQPRGQNGDRIDTFQIIQQYADQRSSQQQQNTDQDETSTEQQNHDDDDELDEDELAKILADLDTL